MNRDWDDFEALPNQFIDLGNDRLLAFGTQRARGRTSGVELDAQPAAWLVRLRNGKVLRMQTFTDRADALEAAGLRGKAPGLTFGDSYQAEVARHYQAGIDSLSMAAVIALCPETERGREILDELEKRTKMHPMKLLKDGTRRYHLHAEDADVDAFDPILNEIDSEWRNHVTNWRAAEGFPWDTFFGARPVDDRQQRDYPPGD